MTKRRNVEVVERKQSTGRTVKEKFLEERSSKIKNIEAKTPNQKLALDSLQKDTLSVIRGSSGTGKSFMTASVAANKLLSGKIDQIVLTRPYVPMGRSVGLLPGDLNTKLFPWLAPILNTLKSHLGLGQFEADLDKRIILQPLEAIRGMDFNRAFIICDESQNTNREEIRSIVTRIGLGTQLALIGDSKQSDIKGNDNGLDYLVRLIQQYQIREASVVTMGPEDIQRNDIVGTFVRIFDKEGSLK